MQGEKKKKGEVRGTQKKSQGRRALTPLGYGGQKKIWDPGNKHIPDLNEGVDCGREARSSPNYQGKKAKSKGDERL